MTEAASTAASRELLEPQRSGKLLLQRVPLAIDPRANRANRRDDRNQQNAKKHRVLDQGCAFLAP